MGRKSWAGGGVGINLLRPACAKNEHISALDKRALLLLWVVRIPSPRSKTNILYFFPFPLFPWIIPYCYLVVFIFHTIFSQRCQRQSPTNRRSEANAGSYSSRSTMSRHKSIFPWSSRASRKSIARSETTPSGPWRRIASSWMWSRKIV